MTEPSKPKFTLGVQAGDKNADQAVSPHYLALRRLLAERCIAEYSPVIRDFAPVLRIDGSIWHWGKSGYGNTQIQRKTGHATVDVFMPTEAWSGNNPSEIRQYLAKHVRAGISSIADKADAGGIQIDRERLLADVDAAIKEFLR